MHIKHLGNSYILFYLIDIKVILPYQYPLTVYQFVSYAAGNQINKHELCHSGATNIVEVIKQREFGEAEGQGGSSQCL